MKKIVPICFICITGTLLVCRQEASFILSPSHDAKLLDRQLATLEATGATGIMLDVWCAPLSVALHMHHVCAAYCSMLFMARLALHTRRPH